MVDMVRATKAIEAQQRRVLFSRYGNRQRFRFGMAYHNLDHSVEVAAGAEASAQLEVARGRLPEWAPLAARLAGLFHDIEQGKGPGANEDASADAAEAALRRNTTFSDEFIRLVREGIDATKVVHMTEGELVQNATSESPFRAVLADNDLAYLGLPGSAYQLLGLFVEWERERLHLPEWASLEDVRPEPAEVESFLMHQAKLHRAHSYLLRSSRRRYAHRLPNAVALDWLVTLWHTGQLTWVDAVRLCAPVGCSGAGRPA